MALVPLEESTRRRRLVPIDEPVKRKLVPIGDREAGVLDQPPGFPVRSAIRTAIKSLPFQNLPPEVERLGRAEAAGTARSAAGILPLIQGGLKRTPLAPLVPEGDVSGPLIRAAERIEPKDQGFIEKLLSGRMSDSELLDSIRSVSPLISQASPLTGAALSKIPTEESILAESASSGQVPYGQILTRALAEGFIGAVRPLLPTNPVELANLAAAPPSVKFLQNEFPILSRDIVGMILKNRVKVPDEKLPEIMKNTFEVGMDSYTKGASAPQARKAMLQNFEQEAASARGQAEAGIRSRQGAPQTGTLPSTRAPGGIPVTELEIPGKVQRNVDIAIDTISKALGKKPSAGPIEAQGTVLGEEDISGIAGIAKPPPTRPIQQTPYSSIVTPEGAQNIASKFPAISTVLEGQNLPLSPQDAQKIIKKANAVGEEALIRGATPGQANAAAGEALKATLMPKLQQLAQAKTPKPKTVKYDKRGVPILKPGSVVLTVQDESGKPIRIKHKDALEYAEGLHREAMEKWEFIKNDPVRSAIARVGIAPERPDQFGISPESGEYERLPKNAKNKNGRTVTEWVENLNEGKAEQDIDASYVYDIAKNLEVPPKPKMGDSYRQAIHDLEGELSGLSTYQPPTAGAFEARAAYAESAQPFYSPLKRAIEAKMPNRAPAQMVKNIVNSQDVKKEETDWIEINEWLDQQKGPVSKESVLKFIDDNTVEIEEVVKGDKSTDLIRRFTQQIEEKGYGVIRHDDGGYEVYKDGRFLLDDELPKDVKNLSELLQKAIAKEGTSNTKFEKYTLPGGENYREVLLTLPEKVPDKLPEGFYTNKTSYGWEIVNREGGRFAMPTQPTETLAVEKFNQALSAEGGFRSAHFPEPNILAHIRIDDRIDTQGNKVLFIEEIQSDWGQKLRESADLRKVSKPESVSKLATDFFGREIASGISFNQMDGGVLALADNDQIKRAIISLLPIDMVNQLGGKEAATKKFLSNPSMIGADLPIDARLTVAQGILDAARQTFASTRTKLLAGLKAGRDIELLPALKASNLTAREVISTLSPQSLYHVDLSQEAVGGNIARGGAEISSAPDLAIRDTKRLPATDAEFLNAPIPASISAKSGRGQSSDLRGELSSTSIAKALDWHNHIISETGVSKPVNYKTANLPKMPFEKSWMDLSLKRILRFAAENGYDSIAWTTGSQQAERYDLSKQVNKIEFNKTRDGQWVDVNIYTPDRKEPIRYGDLTHEKLKDTVGKELAQKIVDSKETRGDFSGLDLKIGGEGMKGFYDQMIPSFLNKYTKKWGGRVGETTFPEQRIGDLPAPTARSFTAHSLDITPSMKESVLQGQSLFEKTGDPYQQELNFAGGQETGNLPAQPGTPPGPRPTVRGGFKAIYNPHIEVKYKKVGSIVIPNQVLQEPADLAYAFKELKNEAQENFFLAAMKNGRIVAVEHLGFGTIDQVAVYPYETINLINKTEADSFLIVHNHPSGEISPSQEDKNLTMAIKRAIENSGAKFNGHVIINDGKFGFINKDMGVSEGIQKEYEKTKNISVLKKYFEWSTTKGEIASRPLLSSPDKVFEVFKGIQTGADEGVAYLLDVQNRTLNAVVLPHGRFNTGTIQNIATSYRAAGIVLVNSKLTNREAASLKGELGTAGIRLMDDIELDPTFRGYKSRIESGVFESPSPYSYGAKEDTGEFFGIEKENVADKYMRLRREAMNQGMSHSEAMKWAKARLRGEPEGAPTSEIKPAQSEFTVEGGVQSFGKGKKGESDMFGSKGGSVIDAFEPIETPETIAARKNFKLADRALEVVRKFAGRIGEKYQMRGAQGHFNPRTNNIRINSMNNVSTVTHEVVHFLDQKFGFIKPLMEKTGVSRTGNPIYSQRWAAMRKAITQAYIEYYPGARKEHKLQKRLAEGLAAFIQQYAQSPSTVSAKYPDLSKVLLGEFSANMAVPPEWKASAPQFKELVDDVRKIASDYQKLDPNEKIGARVAEGLRQENEKLPFMSKSDYLKTETIDDVFPIKRLAQEFGKAGTKADPADWIRVFNAVNSIIYGNLRGKLGVASKVSGVFSGRHGFWSFKNGQPIKVSETNWRDLEKSLRDAGLREQFRNWLIARDQHFLHLELDKKHRAAEEAAKILAGAREGEQIAGKDVEELKKAIKDFAELREQLAKNRIPRQLAISAYEQDKDIMAPFAKEFDTFTRAMVDLAGDPTVGLLTPDQVAQYHSREGYAPLKRDVFDDILAGESSFGGGRSIKPSSFKQRTGSELPIIDPLFSFPHDMAEVFRKSIKQLVINKVANILEEFPQSGLAEPQQLKPFVDKETGKISYPQERDPNILMARSPDGKRKPYLVNAELKKVIEELLDYRSADILARIMRGTSRIFTASTTGLYPPFALMNVISDQIQAASNSMHKTIPFFSTVKVLRKVLFDHESPEARFAAEYLAMGGDRQTITNALSLPPEEFDQWLMQEKKGLDHLVDWLDTGSEILGFPSKVSELSTRMVEYIRSRMAGKEYVNALEDAGMVTGPFHHQGRLVLTKRGRVRGQQTPMTTLVRSIPFFNAGVQSIRVHIESLKGSRGENVRNRAMFVVMASMAAAIASSYWIMKKATKEQKNLYTELDPQELASYIWLPAADGKRLTKIKMYGPQMGLATVFNMGMWEMAGETSYVGGEYADAGTAWLPDQLTIGSPSRLFFSWLPQIIKPWMETLTGVKVWPSVRPLETMGMKNQEPRFRFHERTPEYAKWLGDKLNLSPVKIDHLIEGLMGRGTRPFLGKEIKNPFMREWYFTAGRTLQDYYEQREESNGLYNSLQKGEREFTLDETVKIIKQRQQIHGKPAKRGQKGEPGIDDLIKRYRDLNKTGVPDEDQDAIRDLILERISTFRQGVKLK